MCKEATRGEIDTAISRAMSMPHFLAGLVSSLDHSIPPDGASAEPALIMELAQRCKSLYMLAYDGEAYISAEF